MEETTIDQIRTLMDSLGGMMCGPVWLLDEGGEVCDAGGNPPEFGAAGPNREGGRSFADRVSLNQRHRLPDLLNQCRRDGLVRGVEGTLCQQDGKPQPMIFSFVALDAGVLVVAADRRPLADVEKTLVHSAQLLAMQRDIANVVDAASDIEPAIHYVLDRVAHFDGWEFGHAFLVSVADSDRLVPVSAAYSALSAQLARFSEFSAAGGWQRGEGLPGRVLESGEPVLVRDAMAELTGERAQIAADLGLGMAFAFPIRVDSEVIGVMEFFSSERLEAKTNLEFESIAVIGLQLGRVVERVRAQEAMRDHELRLRQLTQQLRDAVWTYRPDDRRLSYANSAFWTIFGEPCRGDAESWVQRVEQADRPRVARALERLRSGHELEEEFRLVIDSGQTRWIRSRCFPIVTDDGQVSTIVGTAEDISARKWAESARARLEREIREVAEDERRRIARDLHDSLGSLLSAIHMRLEVLREDLAGGHPPETGAADKIAALVKEAISRSRDLTRGLSPVGDDPDDLRPTLRELAAGVGTYSELEGRFHGDQPVRIDSPRVANQLFRIAQEATANAVRHSGGSRLEIGLTERDDEVVLTVEDDGRGFGSANERTGEGGMGLGIMDFRARDIGATLEIGPGTGGQGLRVACAWPRERER